MSIKAAATDLWRSARSKVGESMQFVPPVWRWALKDRRCPCLCGGVGELVVIVCPSCAHLSLACAEVGTVFTNVNDTVLVPCGHCLDIDASGGRCPNCDSADLSDF